MYYNITFKYSETTYCSNIAQGTEEQIKKHYADYEIIAISEASEYDLQDAQRRGKPVIDCTGEEITEKTTETTETTEETTQEGKNMTNYDELMKKALEELKNDDDLFVDMIDELDSWNGYADGFRAWDMSEIDDFYSGCKASKLLDDMTGDFNKYDNYFYFSIYGLESTDDKTQLYRENVDEGELLDNLINNACHLDFWNHKDFEELLNEIEESRIEEE